MFSLFKIQDQISDLQSNLVRSTELMREAAQTIHDLRMEVLELRRQLKEIEDRKGRRV